MIQLQSLQQQGPPPTNMLQARQNIAAGEPLALKAVVRSTKVSITSNAGGGAAETTIYLYNNNYLQTITDNGSGANSIDYNYEDGFGGVLTSKKITNANGAQGQTLYGGYISCFADDVASEANLVDSEPSLLQYNGRGTNAIPTIIEVDDNFSRSDQSDGIGVFTCEQPFNESTQFQINIQGDAAVEFRILVKLYFFPNFKM